VRKNERRKQGEKNEGSDKFRVNREAGDLAVAMEDEDFGFASRTDNALKKIVTSGNERANGKEAVRNDEPKVGFSLAQKSNLSLDGRIDVLLFWHKLSNIR